MLHELLLALNGYETSIFVKKENHDIKVVDNLPFLHPSETDRLNRLCRLATQYSKCSSFIRHYRYSPAPVSPASDLHGLYLCAFCEGLDAILVPYRKTLLRIEQDLLSDPHLTASHVQSSLEEYHILFPSLMAVLEQIQHHEVHGCVILEVLSRASDSGVTTVKHAMQSILAVCHRVLYRQLAAWLLHGIIIDKYNEFFIRPTPAEEKSEDVVSGLEEEDLPVAGITGRQLQLIQKLSLVTGQTDSGPDNELQFSLYPDMLPSYLPTRVADKILFIGETVRMFQRENTSSNFTFRGSILSGKEDEFSKELQLLSVDPLFEITRFESVVDKIRTYVAERLWLIVVEEADLLNQLHRMKEFFLLGRGELYLALIDHANNLLSVPPTGTTQYDANLLLQLSARSVLLQEETLTQKFKLTLATPPLVRPDRVDAAPVPPTGWQLLGLTCTVEWPLHILFTSSILAKYNRLFKFLLYVKRVQLKLQDCWAVQLKKKHCPSSDRTELSSKWWLRNHMAFLIDNLQYYLQVDVIDSQCSILTDAIQATRDFDAIRLALDNFLANLLSHSFLLTKPVSHCLHEILGLCQSFCQLMIQDSHDVEEEIQLEAITKSFQRQSGLLFKMLTGVHNHQAGTHLAKLLLRIDFNKYFTQAGGQLGR